MPSRFTDFLRLYFISRISSIHTRPVPPTRIHGLECSAVGGWNGTRVGCWFRGIGRVTCSISTSVEQHGKPPPPDRIGKPPRDDGDDGCFHLGSLSPHHRERGITFDGHWWGTRGGRIHPPPCGADSEGGVVDKARSVGDTPQRG